MTTVLGIESTAHTFGVGVVKDGKVLSNCKDSFTTKEGEGGMIPIEVAKHHVEVKEKVYEDALKESGIVEGEIEVIAFSQGPGLAPCLLEGMKFTKELSEKLKKPVIGVNHCVAHLEIGKLVGAKDPVMLYASGANTQVIAYEAGKYRVFGETLDLGVGNFIDSIARYLGLGFPGGPAIQKLAEQGKEYIELPYSVKGMDVALSGIQTKLKQLIDSRSQRDDSDEPKYKKEDLAYSLQETVFAMLVETSERALAHVGKKELLLGGGVACNSRLQEMCKIMCNERIDKTEMFVPEMPLLVDNAAMIAYLGEIMFKAKSNVFSVEELDKIDIAPRERTDDIEVSWK
jgi:N6-L-threonylcarbamoyladenine synthase